MTTTDIRHVRVHIIIDDRVTDTLFYDADSFEDAEEQAHMDFPVAERLLSSQSRPARDAVAI